MFDIDIHNACAELVAEGYDAIVDDYESNEDEDFFPTIRIFLDDDLHDLLVVSEGEESHECWVIWVVERGDDVCLAARLRYTDPDVRQAVETYVRDVARDAQEDTEFCARFAVINQFGWE